MKAGENGEEKAIERIANKEVAARAGKVGKKMRKKIDQGVEPEGDAAQDKDCVIV